MNPIKILVVDDHEIIFDGIKSMLLGEEFVQTLDYCPSILELKSSLIVNNYHVLILDINMDGKNTLDVVHEIKAIKPEIKIIILTSYENNKLYQVAKQLDLAGYLLKNTTKKLFIEALHKVINGEKHFQEFNKEFSNEFTLSLDDFDRFNSLSQREKELAELIVKGFNENEISDRLFISKHTVRTHKKNIFKKLKINGVMDLVKLINDQSH
ncbi:MAG: response regulator transcription factor [Cyclobacteriaceae bacterium]|nr:response regulator transcription factor [Cyclobacteriaceae bacterium]